MKIGSCFAGIGGFDLAFQRAGFEVSWQIEIDPKCRELLAAKFPEALRLDDIRSQASTELPGVDVICGGWPCQDLSVSGNRAGLVNGARSNLFYEFARLARKLQPSFLVWENVPGLSSSDDGRDLARVFLQLVDCGYCGCARILDAQYFGLAQRRARWFGVFARSDIGAGRCAEILSIAEGLRWSSPPGGKKRKGIAATIGGSAPSRRNGGSRPTQEHFVSGTLIGTSEGSGFRTTDLESGQFILDGLVTEISGCPRSEGADAIGGSYNGALIPYVAGCLTERDSKGADTQTKPGHLIPTVFSSKNHGQDAQANLAPALRAMNAANSNPNGGGQLAIAFRAAGQERFSLSEISPAIAATDGGGAGPATVFSSFGVRRLTPRECERLQGFPDDWTASFSDSFRYRALGNAVAVPVAEWIARRMKAT